MAAGGANERTWTGIEEIVVPLPVPAGHKPLAMTFCRIPAGAFRMGVRNTFSDQEPIHDIVMPYEYWLGSHIVTYEQYGAVVKGLGLEGNERPDGISWTLDKTDRWYPHEQVAWRDASFWCVALTGWLRQHDQYRDITARLPTEIEWEYAIRAGAETAKWYGDDERDVHDAIWCDRPETAGLIASPNDQRLMTGQRNAFGLCQSPCETDLEWCHDGYDEAAYAMRVAGAVAESVPRPHKRESASDSRRVIRGRGGYTGWRDSRELFELGFADRFRFRVCLVRKQKGSAESSCEAVDNREKATAAAELTTRVAHCYPSLQHAGRAVVYAARRDASADSGWRFLNSTGQPALIVGSLDRDQLCDCPSLDFSQFRSLRHLILWRLTDVVEITGLPVGLERLDVRGCTSLESLPTVTLEYLETLDLGGCTGLRDFPAGIQVPNLRWLYLDGCTGIDDKGNFRLNALLEKAHSLEEFSAAGCTWIRDLNCLPSQDPASAIPSVGDPRFPAKQLKKLVLYRCTRLQRLPDCSSYEYLHHLDLRHCESLEDLPCLPVGEAENRPTGIRTLYLTGCDGLRTFRGLDIRRVHRGEAIPWAIPSAGSKAPSATHAAVNVAGQFRTLSTLADEPAEMRMAKVLFLGSGRCGKTTVAKSLRWKRMSLQERSAAEDSPLDPCPKGGQASTPDIRLDALDMRGEINHADVATRVHVWDFGGQEIYHNTHRLFASEGAVFLIVTTTVDEHARRVEKDIAELCLDLPRAADYREQNRYRELAYWLDYVWEVRGLAGAALRKGNPRNPSVLVVFTGTPPTTPTGADGVLAMLCKQAGRYAALIGDAIPFQVASIGRAAFTSVSTPVDAVYEWVCDHAANMSDELGVRVPGLYAAVESRCTNILNDNQACDDTVSQGKTPSIGKREKCTTSEWGALVADAAPAIDRSPRVRDEIAQAVADYLHACGRVFFIPQADTVVIDQRWAVDLVYEVVVRAMAIDSTRQAIYRRTSGPFDPSWFRELFRNRVEVIRHWEFLLRLLDACNLVIKLPSGDRLAVHPELLAPLDRDAEHELFRQWEAGQPEARQPLLVNHSFAIHDTGNGLLLGRNAFHKIVATVARQMFWLLPGSLFFGATEFEDFRTWVGPVSADCDAVDPFRPVARFWRDGFQIAWRAASFRRSSPAVSAAENTFSYPESLILRMEWRNLSIEGGFRGGIFVQMLCSNEQDKGSRLLEFLFGRREDAKKEGARAAFDVHRAPPLAEYSLDGPNPDIIIHDHRRNDLPADVARSLRGLGSPGWTRPDGPTNNGRFDVAISYRHKESAVFVAALHAALETAGLLCYYDQERFLTKPGDFPEPNTLARIYDTLRKARVLIVVPTAEYFSRPMRADTHDDNLYCPVELAEAILAANPPSTNVPFRPIRRHFWVRPSKSDGDSKYVTRDTLATNVTAVLDGYYDVVVQGRSNRLQVLNSVQAGENACVRRVAVEDVQGTRNWCKDIYGGDQFIEIQRVVNGTAESWDFTAVIAAVRKALET